MGDHFSAMRPKMASIIGNFFADIADFFQVPDDVASDIAEFRRAIGELARNTAHVKA